MGELRLFFIRHGESQAAVDGIMNGHTGCNGLSARGRQQAEALRDRLLRTGELGAVGAVYTSELPRAIETAEILAPAFGGVEIVRDCALCELHQGEADGRPRAEFAGRAYADVFEAFLPGGESVAELTLRAGTRLARIAREHDGESVVVVTHGGVIRAGLATFGRTAIGTGFWLGPEHCSITELHRSERYGSFGWAMIRYSDAAHLEGVS